jgi:hypothetical protein
MKRANNLAALRDGLPRYSQALHRPVVEVFRVTSGALCCELEGSLIVGGLFAIEHGRLEVFIEHVVRLPQEFSDPLCRVTHGIQELLRGRKFRGISIIAAGDVLFDFGRYGIRFDRLTKEARLQLHRDGDQCWELPEDDHISMQEQMDRIFRKPDTLS